VPPVVTTKNPCAYRLYSEQPKSLSSKVQANGSTFMPALMMFGVLGCCCLAAGTGVALRIQNKKRSSRQLGGQQFNLLVQEDELEECAAE